MIDLSLGPCARCEQRVDVCQHGYCQNCNDAGFCQGCLWEDERGVPFETTFLEEDENG